MTFSAVKTDVCKTAKIFWVIPRYFSTFSDAAIHFGDYPDIAEFHATNGRFKRSKIIGEDSDMLNSGKTPKFFAIFPRKTKIGEKKNTTCVVVSKAI